MLPALYSGIATPRKSHPEATLRIFAVFVLGMNLFATFIHMLDLADGARPGKSLLIDFVGLRKSCGLNNNLLLIGRTAGTAPAPALVLGLDAFITIYQLITLYIGYLSYPIPDATSRGFPADPLLPPDHLWGANGLNRATVKDVLFENEDDEESQLTSAANNRQRANAQERSSHRDPIASRSAGDMDRIEEDDDIYSEFDDLLQRTGKCCSKLATWRLTDPVYSATDPDGDVLRDTQHRVRTRHPDDPYTVVNIPLLHMLKTILTYPRPSSVSSVEPSASTTTGLSSDPSIPSMDTARRDLPTVPPSTITDLQLQALAQLHPGLLNASATATASPQSEEEVDDGRADYRRMPGDYTRPTT